MNVNIEEKNKTLKRLEIYFAVFAYNFISSDGHIDSQIPTMGASICFDRFFLSARQNQCVLVDCVY